MLFQFDRRRASHSIFINQHKRLVRGYTSLFILGILLPPRLGYVELVWQFRISCRHLVEVLHSVPYILAHNKDWEFYVEGNFHHLKRTGMFVFPQVGNKFLIGIIAFAWRFV